MINDTLMEMHTKSAMASATICFAIAWGCTAPKIQSDGASGPSHRLQSKLHELLRAEDAQVREAAIQVLAYRSDGSSLPVLAALLKDLDQSVQRFALDGIFQICERFPIESSRLEEWVMPLLESEQGGRVRTGAISYLGRLQGMSGDAIARLKEIMNDPEDAARVKATWALAQQGRTDWR